MLKKCYGLVLGLVVLAGSACVTPTHASSASIVITNIRAGGQISATEEGVRFYNNSSFEVNITNWCLSNKTQLKFACITPPAQQQIFLPAYSYATVVSTAVKTNTYTPDAFYTAVYEPANHTSGAIIASADTITLLDANGESVDQYSWSSSITSTQQWVRMKLTSLPDIYLDSNTASDWQKVTYAPFPASQVEYRVIPPVPEEPELPEDPEESNVPIEEPVEPQPASPLPTQNVILPAIVTELLPNAVGSDTGNEFIEIFNPNSETDVSLEGYKLAVGASLEKVITLTKVILTPGQYKVFTNAELSYSLLNTSSRVSLTTNSGVVASMVPAYVSPVEGESWALIGETWQYTNQPTPGAANVFSLEKSVSDLASSTTESSISSKPCAANQYRSPETNRCRLISSTAASAATPCKVGQERNPETSRCRNSETSTAAAACKEGQERNAETNRCRTIKQLSTAGFGVKGATNKQQGGMGWYIWAAIIGVVLLVVGYAVWEWRTELKKFFKNIVSKFARKKN